MSNNSKNKEKIKITALIKTNNSQDFLCDVLEGLKDFDEVVVLDSHSSDDTVEIAKIYKTKIIFLDSLDLSKSLNQALKEASNDWVMTVFDNEIIVDGVVEEIRNYISNPKKNKPSISFNIKTFVGQKNNCEEFKPAFKKNIIKVFKKDCAEFKGTFEDIKIKGKTHKSKEIVIKYENFDFEKNVLDIIEKNKNVSKQGFKKAQKLSFFNYIAVFLYFYFVKKAFLYGYKGFIFSYLKTFEKISLAALIKQKSDRIEGGVEDDF